MNAIDAYRPGFHFSARRNWLNDPNGLVWFDGEYHLFYQHNPFGNEWGHMSWGHAVSADLVNWRELPFALAEDERASIYSGSVVVADGALAAVYTACLRRPEGGQVQDLAFSADRGRTWSRYAHNPVLDLGLRDFRDPKVFWHEPCARWVMVVVVPDARLAKFFASPDLKTWAWLSDFSAPFEGEGIWECPDLLPLPAPDGTTAWLLKVDVLGGHPSGGTGARLFIGSFDGARFVPEPEAAPRWADFGADFYAALSWNHLPSSPDALARPVWLAWMSCHRYARLLPTSPWRGAMSVPRELSLRRDAAGGWQLLQQPVAALQTLRQSAIEPVDLELDDVEFELLPSQMDGTLLEIELTIVPGDAGRCGLLLRAGQSHDHGHFTMLGIDRARRTLFIDRSRSGFVPAEDPLYALRHEAPLPAAERPLRLHVLLDRCSIEVFANDGECVLTELIFPRPADRGLRLFAEGGSARFTGMKIWPLRAARFD